VEGVLEYSCLETELEIESTNLAECVGVTFFASDPTSRWTLDAGSSTAGRKLRDASPQAATLSHFCFDNGINPTDSPRQWIK